MVEVEQVSRIDEAAELPLAIRLLLIVAFFRNFSEGIWQTANQIHAAAVRFRFLRRNANYKQRNKSAREDRVAP
jgi:hypothetical protein